MKSLKEITTNLKYRVKNFLLYKIALPIIRWCGKDSNYVKHYDKEISIIRNGKPGCCIDGLMDSQVKDLLYLLSTQGDSGFSIHFKRRYFDAAAKFGLLSPLTFKDDEFGESYMSGRNDLTAQNKRLSSVFKSNGKVYDIDAFSIRMSLQHNIDTKETVEGNGLTWSGGTWVHDKESGKWFFMSRGYIDTKKNKTFMGENHVVVPTIEIIDNNCGTGTFIMSITDKDLIPNEFYKDYTIDSVFDTERRSDERLKEDLEFLDSHNDEFVEVLKKLR